ncbi:MAG: hypothetical protein HOV83_26955, partial [Catenulispora sp.]|nr:hypothetical protein [Catenulispora sp.]
MLRTPLRRLAAVAALAFAALGGPAAGAASAHTVGGSGASNYVTTIGPLTPAVPGLNLKVVENGSKLQVENRSGADVVIDGYVGEPYLKVGPTGTYTNKNSPATYLNNDRWGKSPVPPGVDANAAPVWKRVSDVPLWRWHDHRIHWMSTTPPPAVKSAPGKPHANSTWRITLHRDGQTITADGKLAWEPGPSKVLRLAGVVLAAAVALWLCLRGRTLWVALGLVAADMLHSVGVAADVADDPVGAFFKGNVVQLAAWAAALWAAWLLIRRKDSVGARWLAAGAGLLIAAASGVPDLSVLWSSTTPFAWGVTLAQVLVLVITGAGFGMAVALPVHLRLTPAGRTETPQDSGLKATAEASADPIESEQAATASLADTSDLTTPQAPATPIDPPSPHPTGPSRRSFLATGTTSIGGVAAGAAASALLLDDRRQAAAPAGDLVAGLG